jgi:uncharacterized protein YeaO (DUF488 family)
MIASGRMEYTGMRSGKTERLLPFLFWKRCAMIILRGFQEGVGRMAGDYFLKRIYEPYDPADGKRILIDRIWPRGISKTEAKIDLWMKEIAPSPELRKWFGHKREWFQEFSKRYVTELETEEQKQKLVRELMAMAKKEKVTLLYGAKDKECNHAVVLRDFLLGQR